MVVSSGGGEQDGLSKESLRGGSTMPHGGARGLRMGVRRVQASPFKPEEAVYERSTCVSEEGGNTE